MAAIAANASNPIKIIRSLRFMIRAFLAAPAIGFTHVSIAACGDIAYTGAVYLLEQFPCRYIRRYHRRVECPVVSRNTPSAKPN